MNGLTTKDRRLTSSSNHSPLHSRIPANGAVQGTHSTCQFGCGPDHLGPSLSRGIEATNERKVDDPLLCCLLYFQIQCIDERNVSLQDQAKILAVHENNARSDAASELDNHIWTETCHRNEQPPRTADLLVYLHFKSAQLSNGRLIFPPTRFYQVVETPEFEVTIDLFRCSAVRTSISDLVYLEQLR